MQDGKKRLKKVLKYFLICFIVFVIAFPAFMAFRISTGAHLTLRKAKNVKLALQMVEVEYYGHAKTIYDPSKSDNIESGVHAAVNRVLEDDGYYRLQKYDEKKREILELIYQSDHYLVTYEKVGDEDRWTVQYCLKIMGE